MLVAPRVSGTVYRRARKNGDQWYAKGRINGRQFKRRIGPVWTQRGRPPTGYYTRRTAEDALQAILTRHTLAEACEGWLRYIEFDKARAPTTVEDYRRTVHNHFLPAFGAETPVSAITTEQIDAWTERLLADGKLTRSSIQKARVLLHGVFKWAKR